ncbi:mechanosensitive ion channel domain-containing protein, partial [Acidocella sp. KAb 2-4]|uniref:mechanosensitive ion channel domain-containing protein n=1 Tax=Acidocella sp. KAb 2-4 TaxID=2885158 RepID=UPI001D09117B
TGPSAVERCTAAQPDNTGATPFGTGTLGFSVTSAIGDEARHSFGEFTAAVHRSTALGPVFTWLQGLPGSPARMASAGAIGLGLLAALLPAWVVELALRFALRRPAALCARYAHARAPRPAPEEEEQGLADAEAGELEKSPERGFSLRGWSRRLTFALLHLALALLPLLGFAVTLQWLISAGVLSTRAARLAITGIGNAYLVCRLGQEAVRLLIAPAAPPLRLIAMPGPRARAIMRRVVLLLATGFTGYSLIAVAEILGLNQDGVQVLGRLAGLALHLEVAVSIWQSRHLVGGWLAGPPGAEGALAGLRQRLGGIWHYFALFYVLALWVALAAGVQNAFFVLLRVVLVLAGALVLGRLAWSGSAALLDRLFPDSTAASRYPRLAARARAYHPLIRALIRTAIVVLVLLLILQGWGMDVSGALLANPLSRGLLGALLSILVTVAMALALWEAMNIALHHRVERLTDAGRTRQAARLRTLMPMLRATIGTVIFLAAFFIGLTEIGVNATGLLAVSGVAGIALGFGSQKLVQDVITGLFLLLEDSMQVGDYVSLGGMSGTVERLSIRTIRLRGGDGSVNIIPFSSVTTVTNMTRDFSYAQLSITVGYSEDVDRVIAVLTEIGQQMRADPKWSEMIRDDLQIFGLDQFGQLGLVINGQIRTGPGQHWAVRREFQARVLKRFAEEGIEIPYNRQALLGLSAQP